MPGRPLKVEKFRNQTAKPTGSPSHSAISQNSRGFSPNSAASISASVASTSCSSFSYSASSRTKDRTSPASPLRARRMLRDINPSHRGSYSHSYSYLGLDVRVRVVAFERKILVAERENILHIRIDLHHRQRPCRPRQLQPRLFEMVGVEMRVAERVHEIAGLEARHLRHHHRQQRIGSDVEGHAEEHVGRTLIELARQFAIGDI